MNTDSSKQESSVHPRNRVPQLIKSLPRAMEGAPTMNVVPVESVTLNRENVASVIQVLASAPAKFLNNHILRRRNPDRSSVHRHSLSAAEPGFVKGIVRESKQLDEVFCAFDGNDVFQRASQGFKLDLAAQIVGRRQKRLNFCDRPAPQFDQKIRIPCRPWNSVKIARMRAYEHIGDVTLFERVDNRQCRVASFHSSFAAGLATVHQAARQSPAVARAIARPVPHPRRDVGSEFRIGLLRKPVQRAHSRRQTSLQETSPEPGRLFPYRSGQSVVDLVTQFESSTSSLHYFHVPLR